MTVIETIQQLRAISADAHPDSRHDFSWDGTFFVCKTTFSCPALLSPREAADYMNHQTERLIELSQRRTE